MVSTRRGSAIVLSLAFSLLVAGSAGAQSNSKPERFTAVAVNTSNTGPTGTTPVDITIKRWSTDSERDKLLTAFRQQGPDALLKKLQDTRPVGTISTPGSLSYDLRYARELPGEDGGRRIILATDRPIGFWEASNRPRVSDYPFLLIELRVNKDGEGEGKLSLATKLTIDNDVLVIENYADQPVMLNQVRLQK